MSAWFTQYLQPIVNKTTRLPLLDHNKHLHNPRIPTISHGDEAAVEEAHDERERHHQPEGVVAEVGRRGEQHGAEPDGHERDLIMPEFIQLWYYYKLDL